MKTLLIEQLTPAEANIICEASAGEKTMYLQGIMMQGGIRNRNQRVYPEDEIAKAVNQLNEQIQSGFTCLGELNHPDSLTINLDRVSHIITEMWMDGKNAIGKAKILNTPCGNIVKALIEGGARLGVSSRGSGEVVGGSVRNFQFITVDIVSQPSAPDAYPNVVMESLENPKIMTLAEAVVHDPAAQRYLKSEIFKFLTSLTR